MGDPVTDNRDAPCVTAPSDTRSPPPMERSSHITAVVGLGVALLIVTSWVRYHDPATAVAARAAEVDEATEQNAALSEEVRELERRIGALDDGTRGIEREARAAFPLVLDGEMIYELEAPE
jgi:cell division protein FtsB